MVGVFQGTMKSIFAKNEPSLSVRSGRVRILLSLKIRSSSTIDSCGRVSAGFPWCGVWNIPACIMQNCCNSDNQSCMGVPMSVWSDATRYISKAQVVTLDSLNRGMLKGGWNGNVCLGKWASRCEVWCMCRLCM